jgi:hypothetical protein
MLFFKIEKEDWPILTTFLVYVNRMPDIVEEHGIKTSDITLDQKVVSALRKI